jgi:hypothetical protein
VPFTLKIFPNTDPDPHFSQASRCEHDVEFAPHQARVRQ